MSGKPEALRLADALDDEFTKGRISNHNGRKAAAELRRLHAEVEEDDRNLGNLTDDLIKTVAVLRQALEALETDAWQKKLQAAIDIKQHLGEQS